MSTASVPTRVPAAVRRNLLVLPAFGAILVLLVAAWFVSEELLTLQSIRTILLLATFLAILALGQSIVVLGGGIDLSIPWVLTTAGIMLTTLTLGENAALWWVVPLVLLVGAGIGLVNGVGVAYLGVSPLVMTLAVNVIVRGTTLVMIGGTPGGATPPAVSQLMSGRLFGWLPPVFLLVALVYTVAIIGLRATPYGRRLYAIGNNARVAELSGVRVKPIIVSTYVVAGVLSALGGIMLTGYSTLAFVNMGDAYLLPTIAAVVVGGAAITGGRGRPVGTLGGAIMLTLLATLLTAMSLPAAMRNIVFGVVVLVAVIASRERT